MSNKLEEALRLIEVLNAIYIEESSRRSSAELENYQLRVRLDELGISVPVPSPNEHRPQPSGVVVRSIDKMLLEQIIEYVFRTGVRYAKGKKIWELSPEDQEKWARQRQAIVDNPPPCLECEPGIHVRFLRERGLVPTAEEQLNNMTPEERREIL